MTATTRPRSLPRTVEVTVEVAAPPEAVWAVVTDPTRLGEWSHEGVGAEWLDGATAAVPGARFAGHNRMGRAGWTRRNEVVEADAPRRFVWRTIRTRRYPDSTEWTIELTPVGGGTRITQRYEIVSFNRLWEVAAYYFAKPHRDRTDALRGDLERLGAVAAGVPAPR